MSKTDFKVMLLNNKQLQVTGKGTMKVQGGAEGTIAMQNALYVPEFWRNLFSVSKSPDIETNIQFTKNEVFVSNVEIEDVIMRATGKVICTFFLYLSPVDIGSF